MANLSNEKRKSLLRWVCIAEQRLATLKQAVIDANGEPAGLDICLAIDDAITPLRIALGAAEDTRRVISKQSRSTYTVYKANTLGQLIELDIPADAVKSPRETEAAFYARVAVAQRIIEPQ